MRLSYSQCLDQLGYLLAMVSLAITVNGEVDESVSQHTEDVKGNLISGRDFRVTINE